MNSSKLSTASSYKDSGVDIDAGNELVQRIKPLIKATNRIGANTDIGGFGGLFDLKATGYNDPILVSATDGVGTKLKIAQTLNNHETIGIDLVAMCVNDLVVQGAEPLFFLDYFATGKLENDVAESVISGIAEGCKQAGSALIGGETAEMPGMYDDGEYDLAGFSVGAVERDKILPAKNIQEGDFIIGLHSSGIHSNGYSLVRHVINNSGISYNDKPDGLGDTLGNLLLTPTKIYVKTCLALTKSINVKAFAHITGGGLTENIPRILPKGLNAEIDLAFIELPALFAWLQSAGNIIPQEMLRTFNCGIGMIAIISPEELESTKAILANEGEQFTILGELKKGDDISEVVYQNIGAFSE